MRTVRTGEPTLGICPPRAIVQPKRQVRAFRPAARPRDAFLLDRIDAVANAGGIDEGHGIAAQIEKHLDQIARRPGDRRGDGDVAAGQCVHQRRLADIGRPGDDDGKALPQAFGGVGGRERPVDSLDRRPRGAFDRLQRQTVRVLDVGKIDLRLDGRHRLDEAGANRVALAAQRAAGDPLSLSPLRFGFRLDQIGKPFDLRKIDLAIDERAPGEFSRFGKPQSGNSRKRLNDRGGDGPSAGDADFRHLFAGEAARRLEPGDQGPVERLPGARALAG